MMGSIIQLFWSAFCHLHDIRKTHAQFDNNRSSIFGDSLSNESPDGRQIRQTGSETDGNGKPMNCQENMKVSNHLMASVTILL